jgi:hypothetical protein
VRELVDVHAQQLFGRAAEQVAHGPVDGSEAQLEIGQGLRE